MAKHILCGGIFAGLDDEVRTDQTLVIENGRLSTVGPSTAAGARRRGAPLPLDPPA